jgi:transglutaminase-like putative cysteine protease
LAKELQGPTARQTVENIYKWVSTNVRYAGYLKDPRGALYALKYREGDCTEYMYLFVALCRANKIPARGIGGYLANSNPVLKPDAYHNWAESYIDGAWRIIDPQKKVFMPEPARYIALHVIGDAPKNPISGPYKFAYRGEGIQIEMNK